MKLNLLKLAFVSGRGSPIILRWGRLVLSRIRLIISVLSRFLFLRTRLMVLMRLFLGRSRTLLLVVRPTPNLFLPVRGLTARVICNIVVFILSLRRLMRRLNCLKFTSNGHGTLLTIYFSLVLIFFMMSIRRRQKIVIIVLVGRSPFLFWFFRRTPLAS